MEGISEFLNLVNDILKNFVIDFPSFLISWHDFLKIICTIEENSPEKLKSKKI